MALQLERLDKQAFAPFGDVIEMREDEWYPINKGTTRRYHDLGAIQVLGEDGRAAISLARGDAVDFPLSIRMLERHPLGSQAWIPFNGVPFIVVVAPNGPDDRPLETELRAFFADGRQGVNYHAGTWHHPLMSFKQQGDFVVIDRIGTQPNCDVCDLNQVHTIDGSAVTCA